MLFHAGSKCPREGEIKACHPVDSMMREEMTGREGRHGGEDRLRGGYSGCLLRSGWVSLGTCLSAMTTAGPGWVSLGTWEREKVALTRSTLVSVL